MSSAAIKQVADDAAGACPNFRWAQREWDAAGCNLFEAAHSSCVFMLGGRSPEMLQQTLGLYDQFLSEFGQRIIESLETRPLKFKDALITKELYMSQGLSLELQTSRGRQKASEAEAGGSDDTGSATKKQKLDEVTELVK